METLKMNNKTEVNKLNNVITQHTFTITTLKKETTIIKTEKETVMENFTQLQQELNDSEVHNYCITSSKY